MTKFGRYSRNRKKKIAKRKIHIKINSINLVLISVFLLTGLAYLIQINAMVVKGYAIHDLQNQLTDLQEQSRNLELKTLQLQSMENIKSKVDQLDMVAAGKANFVTAASLAAAR